jgi:low affinity Fe/Cu permease
MVFLIQNTQNCGSAVVQMKLDGLIGAASGAHNALLDLEELTERDFDLLRSRYQALARGVREDLKRGLVDTGTADTQAAC